MYKPLEPFECSMLADLVKALTSPMRLRILCLLRGGEQRVSDIVTQTGGKQANVSIQLGILRQKGLLTSRRDEGAVYYAIADDRIHEAMQLLLAVAKTTKAPPVPTSTG